MWQAKQTKHDTEVTVGSFTGHSTILKDKLKSLKPITKSQLNSATNASSGCLTLLLCVHKVQRQFFSCHERTATTKTAHL